MIWPVLAFSVLAAITVVQCNQGCPSGYSRGQYLDASTQKYLLCWKVDWSDMSITFLAKVATAGWIGLGFSPTGFMPNSDVVIGWVKDGQGYLKDRFAAERAQPAIDKIQNVKLLSFSEADGMTTLEFKRDLDACEPRDRSIEEGTTRVIFSYNPNDPDSQTSLAKHTVATRVSINLLSGTRNVKPAPLEANHKTVDVLNRKVSVPARPTTYWCTPFKLPQLQNEAHIIRFAPVVQAGHEELVHHILIYKCHDGVDSYLTMSWDCDNPPNFIPESIQECRESAQIAAWAVGGAGVTFPSHVGLPMSGQTGAQYVMMETHYNNEKSGADYVDSSGIRIYYTPTKRQYDGAVLQFGHAFGQGYNLFLPPRKDNILTETLCPAACTRASFPSKGVNVFGTMLHSHTVGKGIWIEHSRNGVQLPNIDSNYNYDFNFQDVVLLSNEVKILPGDDVQVFCDYDTTSRQHVTLGGEGATDEMCLAFLLVYPRPSLACCVSQIPTQTFIYYIIQAELKGYYVDVTNKSADDRTRFNQRIQALHNMKFGSDDEYTLWDQQYWSARQREVICRDQSHNNLVILDGQSAQYYDLPTIKRVLTDAPTFGTPKPCESIVEAPRPPTGSALDSICDSLWIAFSSFVAITMDY
ncbi:DBH-like monooxygenase protein 1 homolog isoform X1 [Corticium candelabrum]|uniref:DBH-like monooxygenase protein 1 homolog isoform X1 n=1 Tax=Corticium candelabrum TaxID=121492 RepID=UPI002E258398|nr:DBH-like monooxygenase protein 1 homolog isoform X1 [Corticium candelabrum]